MSIGTVLVTLSALLIAAGAVFYMGSYFYGILLIIAGTALFAVQRARQAGSERFSRDVRQALRAVIAPLAGILIAVLIGAVIMWATGYDPVAAYAALFYGGFVKNWHISLLNATPLIFTGLSVALAFKAGLFNIGAEGQYYVGAMVATYFGVVLGLPAILSILLIFILAGLAASLYNFIPAALKVKTGAHEVITTMMFAHVARFTSSIFIRAVGGDPNTSTHPYVTDAIRESNWLPRFNAFLPATNYRMHTGIIIAILVAVFVYYLLYNTKWGFEIRAVGQNPDAARAQGIPAGRNVFRALLLAGCLAGLAGVNQVLGLDHKLFENLQAGYGWNGISVALLASNHPIGVVFTAILWGSLDAGGQYMSRTVQTPTPIVEIIKGIVLFLVVARYLYTFAANRLKKLRSASHT